MTQRFTKAEEEIETLHSDADVQAQLEGLRSLALRAGRAESPAELETLHAELLSFRDSLGPDDDTYDVIVNRAVDSYGIDLMLYLERRMSGQPAEPPAEPSPLGGR